MAEKKQDRRVRSRSEIPPPIRRRAERRFRALYDLAPIGIALLDNQTRILRGNDAFISLVGGPKIRLDGQHLDDLVFEDDRAAVRRILDSLQAHPRFQRIDVRFGQTGNATATLFIGADFEDAPTAGRQFMLATTEQTHLEQRLAQAQKMQAIGQLAGGIAHDFNNLLTAIMGYCDLILRRQDLENEDAADLVRIKQNAERAATLVRQLLAFSRRQILQPRILDVPETLAGLADLLRRLLGESIVLEFQHAPNLGLIFVDQSQFEQVLINLVVNARDAMPRSGVLRIRTTNTVLNRPLVQGDEVVPAGKWVTIEVEDTGVGIAPEILGRIFEPFFSTKAVGQGTGLGLATVYGIMKQTGGFVFVDTAVGRGSTFRLLFPIHADSRAVAPSPIAEPVGEKAIKPSLQRREGKNRTVLITEDEDSVRIFAVRALEARGYTVFGAASGAEALEILRQQGAKIDLLITDMVMPEMDGPTVVAAARKIVPEIKVLCISGYAEEALKDRIRATREVQFLAKPFSLAQFAGVVKEVLTKK
ncbi:MAG: ATP-binding protein [Alphaproteobacteria bacterium]